MIKYTRNNIEKIIDIFKESDYIVRFEKGHFVSGYAIVKKSKIVIINKFFDIEARINTMLEILDKLEIDSQLLTKKSKKFYNELVKFGLIQSISKNKEEE